MRRTIAITEVIGVAAFGMLGWVMVGVMVFLLESAPSPETVAPCPTPTRSHR